MLSKVNDELYFYFMLTCTILYINKRLQVISNKQIINKKPEVKDFEFLFEISYRNNNKTLRSDCVTGF